MKHSIKWGLFIGVSIASVSSLLLQFIPLNYWTLVGILYLYSVVGFITAYIVYRDLRKRMKIKIEKRLEEIFEMI